MDVGSQSLEWPVSLEERLTRKLELEFASLQERTHHLGFLEDIKQFLITGDWDEGAIQRLLVTSNLLEKLLLYFLDSEKYDDFLENQTQELVASL